MNMKFKRIACALLLLIFVCVASGCGGNGSTGEDSGSELTYWTDFAGQAVSGVTSYKELPVIKELMKKTGLDVTYITPANGQVNEQLNLLLASRELPDIIQYPFDSGYPGGGVKALKDGCIQELDLSKAPNLKAYLEKNPHIDKQIRTDDGKYYTFPCIYGDDYLLVYTGIIVRKDILDKIGCEIPETIDEWYGVLKTAKENGVKAPLTLSYTSSAYFAQAYDIAMGLYVEDGKVKYGENEDGFKNFVETMRTWYKEGLIDPKIASMDGKIQKQNVISGDTIAAVGNVGGGIGSWTAAAAGTGAKFEPAPYPVTEKGKTPFYGHRINEYSPLGSAVITTQCDNLDEAYKLLDFGYSEEGQMLYNFGIEGVSYEMIDGYPTYTDLIVKNPEGKSMSEMLGIYASPNGVAPSVKDRRYMEQFGALPEQKAAIELWNKTNAKEHLMPPVSLTEQESSRASKLGTDIKTHIEQMVLKFITGVEPLEKYDEFRNTLKSYGIDEYIQIYQAAYERYQSR